jgi:hypothetical protein
MPAGVESRHFTQQLTLRVSLAHLLETSPLLSNFTYQSSCLHRKLQDTSVLLLSLTRFRITSSFKDWASWPVPASEFIF